MKRIDEIKANQRPLTTPILLVGWLVISSTRDTSPKCDYSALQDAEASGCVLSTRCSPMLLFHPKVALKGTLKDTQPLDVSDIPDLQQKTMTLRGHTKSKGELPMK